ncbi:MAG: TonB-dependent receptor [Bacteroidota bacterium]
MITKLSVYLRFFLLITPVLLISISTVHGQTTFQGRVLDEETEDPLEGANIRLQLPDRDLSRGAATDSLGAYRIQGLSEGRYPFRVTYVGYLPLVDTLVVQEGTTPITRTIQLRPDDRLLDEVVVSLDDSGINSREAGAQRIGRIDIQRVPTPGGSGDLATYLQAMPGVVATGDRGGQLYIRGGLPSQNMILMDGALVYQPFHIVGFFSAFPEELVAGADFYASGFGSRYVGRTASVMDIRMRDGDRDQIHTTASASPYVAAITAEGPVKKGSSSWIGSIRHSLIEQTSGALTGEHQPLHFESQYLKVSQLSENDSRCFAFWMRTKDRGKLDFNRDDQFSWSNRVLAGRCLFLPEDQNAIMSLDAGISSLSNEMVQPEESELHASVQRFYLNSTYTQFMGDLRFDLGMHSFLKWMDYDISELIEGQRSEEDDLMSLGFHGEVEIPLGSSTSITPGLALSVYPNRYPLSLEPRIRAQWRPFGDARHELYAAVGIYRQALAGVSDLRDASSVFTAWMLSPIGDQQMESRHLSIGWRQPLVYDWNISFEGYGKQILRQPVTVWSSIARFTTELALADGRIFGADLRLEWRGRRLYGFVGYGISWVEYQSAQDHFGTWFGEPIQRYHPPHDRRHQIQSMARLDLESVTLNARWQLGSGFPFTRHMGFDELHYFHEEPPNVRKQFGSTRVVMERPYDDRLPAFHRLDLSAERSFQFPLAVLTLQIGAINSYNRSNLFYYDVYTGRRVDQMPFSPYFSIRLETQR